MDRDELIRLGRAALPIVAIIVFPVSVGAMLAAAGETLGYDFHAYLAAAVRALDGLPLYDRTVDVAGGFAIFLYPPPFVFAILPFTLLPEGLAVWAWEGLMVAAFLGGAAILPVRSTIRWAIVLLGALDWPLLYAIKLGQVGPLLFLLFAIGWRSLDRPTPLGLSIAAGAIVKVQPVLLIGWALLTGRWRSVAVAAVALAVAGLAATLAFGVGVWADYLALLGRVSAPVTTPHNFTPGAIAFRAGMSEEIAAILQLVVMAGVLGFTLIAIRYASADVSFVTTAVATQLLSPLLWDHYAAILLLPTAWLLERRRYWAVAIPLLTSVLLIGGIPDIVYPMVFSIGLVAPALVEWRADGFRKRPIRMAPAMSD